LPSPEAQPKYDRPEKKPEQETERQAAHCQVMMACESERIHMAARFKKNSMLSQRHILRNRRQRNLGFFRIATHHHMRMYIKTSESSALSDAYVVATGLEPVTPSM